MGSEILLDVHPNRVADALGFCGEKFQFKFIYDLYTGFPCYDPGHDETLDIHGMCSA